MHKISANAATHLFNVVFSQPGQPLRSGQWWNNAFTFEELKRRILYCCPPAYLSSPTERWWHRYCPWELPKPKQAGHSAVYHSENLAWQKRQSEMRHKNESYIPQSISCNFYYDIVALVVHSNSMFIADESLLHDALNNLLYCISFYLVVCARNSLLLVQEIPPHMSSQWNLWSSGNKTVWLNYITSLGRVSVLMWWKTIECTHYLRLYFQGETDMVSTAAVCRSAFPVIQVSKVFNVSISVHKTHWCIVLPGTTRKVPRSIWWYNPAKI